jgi:FkbH-like protein
MTRLYWLPKAEGWRPRLQALAADPATAWPSAVTLANLDLDFVKTNQLDNVLCRLLGGTIPSDLPTQPVRLAILSSSTITPLLPAIRVAGLRRNMHVTVKEGSFGQYWQDLTDANADVHAFRPTVVLFALDAYHLATGLGSRADAVDADAALGEVQARLRECWALARERFGSGCQILQQTLLPVHPLLLGSNEHRLPGSKAGFIARLNAALRPMSDNAGVDLVALDERAAVDGLAAWHDPALWHRAKQEVSPAMAPLYGDLVLRTIAAHLGRAFKCLVMDLDNTLWGGVVGDDGLGGIVLGQGSALGEAFVAFQTYARDLSRRGVILAVSSKNDEPNAIEPFDRHPDMVLRRGDIACFAANWSDKASNIGAIANELNIGLDSIVFLDDNPFERNLVRGKLPMVAVPEVGDDPTMFPRIIADAGYFDGLRLTDDDRQRGGHYQGNLLRQSFRTAATDLPSYLCGLEMTLLWRPFDAIGIARIEQLINKTNQFNLTTRRMTEADALAVMGDSRVLALQLRLLDRFGDNGVIAIVIGRIEAETDLVIDIWLMSCRVLGRQVEQATLNIIAAQGRRLGALRLVGDYIPTAKNRMVKDHYARLGFTLVRSDAAGGSRWVLDLQSFISRDVFIGVREG